MRQINLEDCRNLKNKFEQYCEIAEQHEFLILIILQTKLHATLKMIEEEGEIKNQKEARAMFRLVLRIIGENADEYEEVEE